MSLNYKKIILGIGLMVSLSQANAQVDAEAGKALSESKRCVRCHKMDEKGTGPSVREIAGKYKGVAGAQVAVLGRMRAGSKGIWGDKAMTAVNKDVTDEDLKVIVSWMLAPR